MSKAIAIGFRVHVKPDVSEVTQMAKKMGIQLAPTSDRRSEQNAVDTGVVLDIGPDAWKAYNSEPWVAVGDKVVYSRYAGKAVGPDDDFILVLNDEDIVCKLVEDNSV